MIETKFKNSEVGLIPEEWDVNAIGGIAVILNGSTPPTADPANYGNTYLFASPADLGGEKYVVDTLKKLSSKGFSISRKFPKGSILYTCTGSTIGKCGIAGCDLTSNQQINAILPNDLYNNEYLYYALQTRKKEIKSNASIQAVPLINKNTFSKTLVALPAPKEQSRIATALSDIDDLIATTKKLIEKKRNIKEGAMQELLSGKRRLPGFIDKWVEKTLGEICKPYKGSQINKNDLELSTGYPVMNGGITPSGFHHEFNEPANTIIMSEGGNSCGFVSFMRTPFWAGGHCYVLRPQEPINLDYLYQVLKFCEPYIMDLRTGSGLPNIKKTALNDFALKLSLNEQEQTGIATVLSDMDSELQSLVARLTKYQSLKQGMMQQLLTGKIRLI